jgi:hypothetical protein
MSGSGASNLGYSRTVPFSNVNGSYVNKMSTNNPANFSSNEIPTGGANGLSGIKDNVLALSGKVSNMSFFKGGAIKKKIKNITKLYKMRSKSKSRTIKRKLMSKYRKRRSSSVGGKRRRKTHRGGYSQYMNNYPMTPSYSVGDVELKPSLLAMANPPPITRHAGGAVSNCTDNYNHYTGKGFPSRGH